MHGLEAAKLLMKCVKEKESILDVGSGKENNDLEKMAKEKGCEYVPFDLLHGNNWESHLRPSLLDAFDAVVMCHSLEHMLDVHSALLKIHTVLREGGILSVTVPPMKDEIVGGHLSLWNAGLLLYRLVRAGFDCSKAAVKTYAYNCSVLVRRKPFDMPPLRHDHGDIAVLAPYFPMAVSEQFDGRVREINWRKL